MKALLIIDMQKGSFKPYSIRHDTLGIIKRINSVAELFRQKNHSVIFIQHDGTKENCFLPDTEDWELLSELMIQPGDIIVSKTANDSFYNSKLGEILSANSSTEIYITGCATDFCVDTTVKSALSKDYRVTIVEDCHTTADRPYATAETIIRYYNWIWSEMSPTKYKLKVIKSDELM